MKTLILEAKSKLDAFRIVDDRVEEDANNIHRSNGANYDEKFDWWDDEDTCIVSIPEHSGYGLRASIVNGDQHISYAALPLDVVIGLLREADASVH